MAKKGTNKPTHKPVPNRNTNGPGVEAERSDKTAGAVKTVFVKKYANILVPALIAIITFLFYKASLNNQFTNWDDPSYINDNPLIKDISGHGLKNIFSTSIMGNYHPLTILSYAIEYSKVGLDPWLYHLDS